MIPLDFRTPYDLFKKDLQRIIDEIHNVRQWRPLDPKEVLYLEECQRVLKMKTEVERVTGVRE